jgi:predicted transcriptional regulator
MKVEAWSKVISPNVYRLFDKHICPKCKLLKTVELGTVDKNTDSTRRHMREMAEKKDIKTKVFKEKTISYPYKEDINDDIDPKELF